MENIYSLLTRCGLGSKGEIRKALLNGQIFINNELADKGSSVSSNAIISINNSDYQVTDIENKDRLMIHPIASKPKIISGQTNIYCGLHKCLTMYTRNVFRRTCKPALFNASFRHFYHRDDVFYGQCNQYTISSISGYKIDLDLFEDPKVVRFIRDPRDLLISAYFYHKRSAEEWCDIADPTLLDWKVVNGFVPTGMPPGQTFAQYLNSVSLEEGLLAEIEFRKYHYQSMLDWPENDERVKLFRYEDIMGHEVETFNKVFEFYELPFFSRQVGKYYAKRYSAAKKIGKTAHIRNAQGGQWREYFTAKVAARFNESYAELLTKYGYPLD